jgi:hypothetical protein
VYGIQDKIINISIGSKSVENAAKFRCVGTTVKNQIILIKKFRGRLIVILSVVLYGYGTWSVTPWKEHRFSVWKRIFIFRKRDVIKIEKLLSNDVHTL